MTKILLADQDPMQRQMLRKPLEKNGFIVEEAETGKEALDLWSYNGPYHAAIIELELPRICGNEVLKKIKETNFQTLAFVISKQSTVPGIVAAIKLGAAEFLVKPIAPEHLVQLMNQFFLTFENPISSDPDRQLIGSSPKMRKIYELIKKLAKVSTTVLIRGESGTGKELIAQALHKNSNRADGPFVAVNCGAIPENLIESELFGHEKGTFTGADRRKLGKFQFASGGTIFLDEVGDVSLQMQTKLLRVLQEKIFTPVGSNHDIEADVRVISATNKNLEEMIVKGSFRSDLYYRLNVLPLYLPPLRERKEDIRPLVDFIIKKFNRLHCRNIAQFSDEAFTLMLQYEWPGNIRELENVIEHAFIIEVSNTIRPDSLPPYLFPDHHQHQAIDPPKGATGHKSIEVLPDFSSLKYPILKEQFEREFIQRALKTFNGRINQTVEHTQMTKVTLLRKLEKYGISPKEFQN